MLKRPCLTKRSEERNRQIGEVAEFSTTKIKLDRDPEIENQYSHWLEQKMLCHDDGAFYL